MGSFKIKKAEYVNKTFRIPKDLAEELSVTAQGQGVSVNELVVQCCRYSLKNLDTEEADQKSATLSISREPGSLS